MNISSNKSSISDISSEKIDLESIVFRSPILTNENTNNNKEQSPNDLNIIKTTSLKKNNSLKGYNALKFNESNNNSAFGFSCMKYNKKGYQNTSLGAFSMINNESGINNTAIGHRSLMNINSDSNTAIGTFSGNNLEKGKLNVLIGRNTQTSNQDSINEIVIGSYAKGHGNNSVVLGNNNILSIEPGKNSSVDLGSNLYNFKNIYYSGNLIKDNTDLYYKLDNENIDIISNGNFHKKSIILINKSTSDKKINLLSELSGALLDISFLINNVTVNLPSLINNDNIGIYYDFIISGTSHDKYLEIVSTNNTLKSLNNNLNINYDKDSDKDSDEDSDEDLKINVSNSDSNNENINQKKKYNQFIFYQKYDFIKVEGNKIIYTSDIPVNTIITCTALNYDEYYHIEKWLINIQIPV